MQQLALQTSVHDYFHCLPGSVSWTLVLHLEIDSAYVGSYLECSLLGFNASASKAVLA
jgi:hypothetical protein